ncbi:hypothetical protein CERSUDRAFT_78839 [Gelatoporia subvermispora B]|uniref:Uncharacterized protein n=1 Tax=Ceriporiopsis subvermispora (strain B) TaxID=914234 RepID=M2QEB3_CERS8|nr:hypothetical protein CERSUDRAFT_78839 [Gelatoporia subvermispora B]
MSGAALIDTDPRLEGGVAGPNICWICAGLMAVKSYAKLEPVWDDMLRRVQEGVSRRAQSTRPALPEGRLIWLGRRILVEVRASVIEDNVHRANVHRARAGQYFGSNHLTLMGHSDIQDRDLEEREHTGISHATRYKRDFPGYLGVPDDVA